MRTVRLRSLGELAKVATTTLKTFQDGKPDLIQTGIRPFDKRIGGLFPGHCGVLALATGVGKTSTILAACLQTPDKVAIISTEDTEDTLGAKLLADLSGVDSLAIRTKRLTTKDVQALRSAQDELQDVANVHAVCHPGATLEAILAYVDEAAEAGCRLVYLDYLQKVRGVRPDRANEVAQVYTSFQERCFRHNMACFVASQFNRQCPPNVRPKRYFLKETGDIENEARYIIFGWRDPDDTALIHYVLDKSMLGGEELQWSMRRDASGTLRYVDVDMGAFDFDK